MAQRIVIDPVTRIEGHAKITIYLDDTGQVTDARFHVTEFRGFERFCEGRPLYEMPGITARVCGICPVSHLLASAKAGDAILAVSIPPAAEKLRRLMNLGQIVQSHALSFFHLSAPDFLLGVRQRPGHAERFRPGRCRARAGPGRHPPAPVRAGDHRSTSAGRRSIRPGRCRAASARPSREESHGQIAAGSPRRAPPPWTALGRFKRMLHTFEKEAHIFGNFPSLFMGLVGPDGAWEHYDGHLRFVDSAGNIIADRLEARRYQEFIGEAVESHSYLKSPYYRPLGYPDGIYRVGPLARLNVCSHIGTPLADQELREFRDRGRRRGHLLLPLSSCAADRDPGRASRRSNALLDDPDLLSDRLRADAGINQLEGVGVSEAPRGTLFHHYRVDEHGLIQKVNLIIATGQNNLAMNRTVAQIARHYVRGPAHSGRDAESGRGGHPRVRSLLELFDPRRRHHAAPGDPGGI